MNRTHTKDPCAGTGTCLVQPAEFVRLRYFFGQRLGVVDLADEQSYFSGKQRFHNLRAHGAGVLCGLRAERYVSPQVSPPTSVTTLLRVRRGAALDACGREIIVGWDQCIDVAAWFAQHPAAHPVVNPEAPRPTSLRLWVALCYLECPSDPSPAPRDPCGCDAGGCEFARIREGFLLKLLTDDEADLLESNNQSPSVPAPVAEEVLGGPLESAYTRIVAVLAGADCPEPPIDPCLLLANFQATLDGDKVVDITAPDNSIAERLTLLSTATLQRGLLRALVATSDAELIGSGPRFSAVTFKNGGANSGSLSIEIDTDGTDLSHDPFATPQQLTVRAFHFKDDGTWDPIPPSDVAFPSGPPPRIEIHWSGGLVNGGRYRVLIESDHSLPPIVDKKMRPLTPLSWARHFRLVADAANNLILADSLYPQS